jgi:hypothetical protein
MRLLGTFVFVALLALACRAHVSSDTAVNVEAGTPDIALFAWSRSDLPSCFSGREGKLVYVQDQQRAYVCDAVTSSWK